MVNKIFPRQKLLLLFKQCKVFGEFMVLSLLRPCSQWVVPHSIVVMLLDIEDIHPPPQKKTPCPIVLDGYAHKRLALQSPCSYARGQTQLYDFTGGIHWTFQDFIPCTLPGHKLYMWLSVCFMYTGDIIIM